MGSNLKRRSDRQDSFYKQAKREQYPARSVYKLEELDQRFHLFKPGNRVLDLGCRPGSWLLYVSEKIGEQGQIVGLDREPLNIVIPANAIVLVGDVLTISPAELRSNISCFHTVLSDMAPDTTGIAFTDQTKSVELFMRAVELSSQLTCPGGNFVGKLFMGDGFSDAAKTVKKLFGQCKTIRPQATRKNSTEVYIVGLDKLR